MHTFTETLKSVGKALWIGGINTQSVLSEVNMKI